MRCTSPRTVGFKADGKTISWSPKTTSKEYAEFQLPCSKCIECRLEYARSWAVRATHEAQMHPESCFITLTYSDTHLKSPKLIYKDWQNFMKKLRKTVPQAIGVMVVGEYGEKTKRPHWHAILFNFDFKDKVFLRENELGDKLYTSKTLEQLWGKNDSEQKPNEIGNVTFKSAGYVARYSTKKLVHGLDDNHDFHPIFRTSSKHAIAKKWLETYYLDVFSYGHVILNNGQSCPIPRYYEKWLKKEHPDVWINYLQTSKEQKLKTALEKSAHEKRLDKTQRSELADQYGYLAPAPQTKQQARRAITKQRFELLQSKLKL